MFNRQQREELNKLSELVFGSSSRWQKLIKDGTFRVYENDRFDGALNKYVRLKDGSLMSVEKAVEKGFHKLNDEEEAKGRSVIQTREPTFEEIKKGLEDNLEMLRLTKLSNEHFITVVAHKKATNQPVNISLVTKEDAEYQKTLEELCSVVPEARREEIKSLIVKSGEKPIGYPIDAVQFVTDFIFSLNHTNDSAALVHQVLNSVVLNHKQNKNQQQPQEVRKSKHAKGHTVSSTGRKDKGASRKDPRKRSA
jgi:hypothetical protein